MTHQQPQQQQQQPYRQVSHQQQRHHSGGGGGGSGMMYGGMGYEQCSGSESELSEVAIVHDQSYNPAYYNELK